MHCHLLALVVSWLFFLVQRCLFFKCTSDKGLSSAFLSDLSKGIDLLVFWELVMGVTKVQRIKIDDGPLLVA